MSEIKSGPIGGEAILDLEPGVYGEKDIRPLLLNDLIILDQVRNVLNPEVDRLSESIIKNGLINNIDVALLTREEFDEYVHFVNKTWRVDLNPADYQEGQSGLMELVIAGHTRAQAVLSIEHQKDLDRFGRGLSPPSEGPIIFCKVKEGMSPFDIISMQLAENIYSAPSMERKAMAIVETYFRGIEIGMWGNKAEFLRHSGDKFGRSVLNDALHFSDLPTDTRDMVLSGAISYRAGVELGRASSVYKEFVLTTYFDDRSANKLDDAEKDELDVGINEWVGRQMLDIQNKNLNVTVSKARIASIIQDLQEKIALMRGEDGELRMDFQMADPITEWRSARRIQLSEYKMLLRELASAPLVVAANALNIHTRIISKSRFDNETSEVSADLNAMLNSRLTTFVSNVGITAVNGFELK